MGKLVSSGAVCAKAERQRPVRCRALALLAALTACGRVDAPSSDPLLYPIAESEAGIVTFEFGPGSVQTTSDTPWGGADSLLYPGLVDSEAGPVEMEIQGLDLSEIEYGGDMGWPPDPTDTGPIVQAALIGSSDVSYRLWSSLGDLLDPAAAPSATEDLRSYLFQGSRGGAAGYGVHRLNVEGFGPPGRRAPYNTVDLRVRYEEGVVNAWVRLHASREWEEGGSERGAACPWNIALNNVIDGTADSVWAGECRVVEPEMTGRAVGAWVPVAGGAWTVGTTLGLVQAGLSISNWEFAAGPYRVTWRNLVLRGSPGLLVRSSAGEGLVRPFGTGRSEIEPRGEQAEFRFYASDAEGAARAGAVLHYRTAGFELASGKTNRVTIERDAIELEGEAVVNGRAGFRYELRGASTAGDEPDSLSLQVWSPESSVRPHYVGFGPLAEGSIETRVPAQE